ncbi:amidase domain-containing protein [Gordonia sp. ABSL11-1]|uniref:amidase domain-containing protein n=1 Tax=Gordonia sp. ABSL11-1 TaxID=3053924 RepID=UPI002572FC62|nr:amidase domain-containing protein [Gordonia sp. ABSL11-1]MDL9947997.1 amidase domain-containing protein [Gordonia sp. ABSL11-1]
MVTYAQLRDARPNLWETAADDVLGISKQAERTADNIHANGVAPLADEWPDHTGTAARETLVSCAKRMTNAGVLARGVATALDTLEDSVGIAQRALSAASTFATSRNLTIDDAGRVSVPDSTPTDQFDQATRWRDEAQSMIDDAVEAATQADQSCVDAIIACSADPDNVSTEQARESQATAVRAALKEVRNQLPDGQTPAEVERWWASLTPEQQQQLRRAIPVELHDLDGIPASVKRELTDTGRGYDPVKTVRWALANAENEDIDIFGNNCANFVSHSLDAGGLGEKLDGWGTLDDDNWGRSAAGEGDWIPGIEGKTHTKSWYNSDAQREFFLEHGGEQVTPQQARPGDVVYFNYAQPHASGDHSHHAAVVTGVLPDGQILYTQHTPGAANLSVQDRLPMIEQGEGDQTITIVRPKESW